VTAICEILARVGSAILVGGLLVLAGGCSTMADLNGIPRPGYQNDGTYVLSAQEQESGCRALQERQLGLQQQLQDLPAKAVQEMQALPTTVVTAWGRLVGSTDQGVPSLAQYNEAKAESAAVSESMTRKGCSAVDTASLKH
jgi:hypothetical protein